MRRKRKLKRRSIARYQKNTAKSSNRVFLKALTKIKKLSKRGVNAFVKHRVGILSVSAGIIIPLLAIWWGSLEPDIRINVGTDFSGEFLDKRIEGTGQERKIINHVKLLLSFKNFSFKPGFVDRVELVPLKSVADLPQIREINVNKQRIGWREEKPIEVRFIIAAPCDLVIKETNILPPKSPDDIPTLEIETLAKFKQPSWEFEVRAFDNTGKSIDTYMKNTHGRLTITLSQPDAETQKTK